MCALDGRGRLISHRGARGVCSDSSTVDNKALAVNVLLPGTMQGHSLLQMLEAGIELVVVVGGGLVPERQKGVDSLKDEWN